VKATGGATGALPRAQRGSIVFARSTTIQARPESIDEGIAHVTNEVLPALQAMDGCVGLSLLVDRATGRCIATSAWQSEDAMRASADSVLPVRDRAAERFGASGTTVEEWEIAVLHRDHTALEGACARSTWLQLEPSRIDGAIDIFKNVALPQTETVEGFCSSSLLVNRASGRAVTTMTYDSKARLDSSRERAQEIRTSGTQQAGAEILEVSEFELAIAHLRVPELV
jgi:quinol monooxygenase YgiN